MAASNEQDRDEALEDDGMAPDPLTAAKAPLSAETAAVPLDAGGAPVETWVPPAAALPSIETAPAVQGPERWGRYTIEKMLGRGGMGIVYKAYDEQLQRHVAIKQLRAADPALVERLLREARSQVKVQHEHICKIYEVAEHQGKPYIAMQYLDGETLLEAGRAMTLEEKARVMQIVAEALHEAHKQGLVHRDVKPQNIMVERSADGDWRPYVMDFGIAREIGRETTTIAGNLVGTPMYMAPEQVQGGASRLDRRTDVYALGATMYELFSGRAPFEADTTVSLLLKITEEEPEPLRRRLPSLPIDLEAVVMKCLEKEPRLRYQSANALADDIGRFLSGEPVLARKVSGVYRMVRRARRHKWAVGGGAFAATMVIAFGGYSLHVRAHARSQALAAQKFGIEAKEIEALQRFFYMSPIHNTRPEMDALRMRVSGIVRMMEETGDTAFGPGHYAIGRGQIVLRNYQQAREHLEQAWSSGFRDPMVALALGRAFGALYMQELDDVRGISDKALREAKQQEIERAYRDPAIRYLAMAGGQANQASEGPEYVRGLIAFYEKDYERALKLAKVARTNASWLYEAALLEGDVHFVQGGDLQDSGSYDSAMKKYELAETAYQEALQIARSDPQIYERSCAVLAARMRLELWETGGDLTPLYAKLIDTTSKALEADPKSAEIYSRTAEAQWLFGSYKMDHGQTEPAIDLYERSIESAGKAIALRPRDPTAVFHMGVAYSLRGLIERNTGMDPRESLRKAVECLARATSLDPSFERAFTRMGIAHFWTGQWEATHGIDPHGTYAAAIECYRKAIQIQPRIASPHANTGNIYAELAVYEGNHGMDPTDLFTRSVEAYRKALELNPHYIAGLGNLGEILCMKGRDDLSHGIDPRETFRQAAEYLAKVRAANPQFKYAILNAGLLECGLAEYELLLGEDPRPSLAKAKNWHAKLVGQFGDDLDAMDLDGRRRLLLARDSLERGQQPREALDAIDSIASKAGSAGELTDWFQNQVGQLWMLRFRRLSSDAAFAKSESALRKAIELSSENALWYTSLAELYLERARKGGSVRRFVDAGLMAADKAISINRRLAAAHAHRGELLLVRAEAAADDATRREAARSSRDAFGSALALNPLLTRQYTSLLRKADALLGTLAWARSE